MTSARSEEAGFTLIEVLLAMTIIGIAVLAVLGALRLGIDSGRVQRELAVAELEARTFAEHVKAASYIACAGPADYDQLLAYEAPDGMTATLTDVEHWDGALPSGSDPLAFGPVPTECDGDSTDTGLQRVHLVFHDNVRDAAVEMAIVKREPGDAP